MKHMYSNALRGSLFAVFLLMLTATSAHAQAKRLAFGGETRRYIVYTPASYAADTTRSYPVVLNFHGGGMTMAEQMLYTRMNETADTAGFIVVYPQGLGQDWNVGFETSYSAGTDDVGFIEAVLDQIEKDYRIDTARIYATGLSRGGFFCHRLAAEISHRIAAIASVGAPLPNPVRDEQRARGGVMPVGVLQVHGTADEIVKYEGKDGAYASAETSYLYWRERAGLSATTERQHTIDKDRSDDTHVTIREAAAPRQSISLITIHGGGHTWAGTAPFNVGLRLGRTTQDLDLNATIWSFLSRHTRHMHP